MNFILAAHCNPFYRITEIEVEIVRIVDGRQDLTQLFTTEDR